MGAEEETEAETEGTEEDEIDGAIDTAATGAAAVLTGVDPREERSKNERNCKLLSSPVAVAVAVAVAVPAVARLAARCVGDVSDE